MSTPPPEKPSPGATAQPRGRRQLIAPCTLVLVAVVAIGLAASMAADQLSHPDALWGDALHDRNGHFEAGQRLAIALRTGNVTAFLDGLERAKIWPPLHDLSLGLVLAVAGIDHRFGTVPATLSWLATVVLLAALAFDSVDDRTQGAVVALLASAFYLSSPALRLLAGDVMLELPGAALSAACLFLFGRAAAAPVEQRSRAWRRLALALTLLFLTKYNYWLLCGCALVACSLVGDRARAAAALGASWRLTRGLGGRALRHPAALVGATLLVCAAAIQWRGPTSFPWPPWRPSSLVSLYPPNNLLTLGYAAMLLALLLVSRDRWWRLRADRHPVGRSLVLWHALPVAVWLLLPDRLAAMFWFLSPGNRDTAFGSSSLGVLRGASSYASAFVEAFHAAPAIGWLAALLFAAALVFSVALRASSRLRPTGRAVLAYAVVCAALVLVHPNRQPRFLAHWLFAVWLGAAIAAALILWRVVPERLATARLPLAAGSAVLIGAVSLHAGTPEAAWRASQRPAPGAPSDLEVTSSYLARIDPSRPHGVIATFGRGPLPRWTAREACRCLVRVEQPWIPVAAADAREVVADFLESTPVDWVVVLSIPSYPHPAGAATLRARDASIEDALAAQVRFVSEEAWSLSSETTGAGGPAARASLWRRAR